MGMGQEKLESMTVLAIDNGMESPGNIKYKICLSKHEPNYNFVIKMLV